MNSSVVQDISMRIVIRWSADRAHVKACRTLRLGSGAVSDVMAIERNQPPVTRLSGHRRYCPDTVFVKRITYRSAGAAAAARQDRCEYRIRAGGGRGSATPGR